MGGGAGLAHPRDIRDGGYVGMARWQDVIDTAPEFAKAAQAVANQAKGK